jgi:hypothetical protein
VCYLQAKGNAKILEGKERERYIEMHIQQNPVSAKYRDDISNAYILVTLRWARFKNMKTQEEFEIILS